MSARTPAEELVQVLRRSGVDRVYGPAAQALEPIADAVWRTDGIEWTEVQDERAGVVAAADDAQGALRDGGQHDIVIQDFGDPGFVAETL